ncbi:MAC Perforin domain containing [Micractinium conductrix]|uniref:MAC Perforin domain containing n=1 Tax=Micractinium conductrix TaxID=554055 RepID=A0A2P6VJA1_9CHLO|nr:MAC Perforin domain containing [Micractinium conductrix]|eukprot:PSC74162.1 MAC Perforin domain containing [Micractinium conductrix]
MQRRFVRLGLYKQLGKIPPAAVQALRRMVLNELAVKRSTVPFAKGCGLVYVTQQVGNPRRTTLAPGQVGRPAAGGGSSVGIASVASTAAAVKYSVLGQGYNCLTGLPLSAGMSSLDPGFTLQPVFQLASQHVTTVANNGGGCTSQFSTTVYNSMSQFKQSISADLSLEADFGAASLSANANFDQLTKTSSMSQTITTTSSAKVALGALALRGGPPTQVLHPAFIANVRPLVTAAAADPPTIDQYALQSFLDSYGTHYIRDVDFGGLAAVTTQMTAAQYSSFTETDVSVSVAAQVAMVQVTANVDYNSVQTDTVRSNTQTFGETLIPALVNITLFNPSLVTNPETDLQGTPVFIDCVAWTDDIRVATQKYGWRAPVAYKVAPLDALFVFPSLWPVDMQPHLAAVRATLRKFTTTCGYTTQFDYWKGNITANPSYSACPVVDTNCVKGTYPIPGTGTADSAPLCNTCFGDGTDIAPMCNTTAVVSCHRGYCYCRPQYAPAGKVYDCSPLNDGPDVNVNEGQFGVAQCPAGLIITNILRPQYGTGDFNSTLSFVEVYRRCIGQTVCVVPATNDVFGDPIFGVGKKLQFNYECDYPRYVGLREGASARRLSCADQWCTRISKDIRPYYGNIGHKAECNATGLMDKVKPIMEQTTYDADAARAKWADGGLDNRCNNAPYYDLGLKYSCEWQGRNSESAEQTASAVDGGTVSLACGCRRIKSIVSAQWKGADCNAADVVTKVRSGCLMYPLQSNAGFKYGTCNVPRITEVAWHLWTQYLHTKAGFVASVAGPTRTSISKLMPQTFFYNREIEEQVPGDADPVNTADWWSNVNLRYDPLWLYPWRSLLSDNLIDFQEDARRTRLYTNAVLDPLLRATKGEKIDAGFREKITQNPNNPWVVDFLLGYMPSWQFDPDAFTEAFWKAVDNADANLWACDWSVTKSQLTANLGKVSWDKYTLEGSANMGPQQGLPWEDFQATPQWNFLDLVLVGIRKDLMPGFESLQFQARGFYYGPIGPKPTSRGGWFNFGAFSAPLPSSATRSQRETAANYFAARWGRMPTVPTHLAAVVDPLITIRLTQPYFNMFINYWQNGTADMTRQLCTLAWCVKRKFVSDFEPEVFWDVDTRTVYVQPQPLGQWYRLAQTQKVVNVPVFFGGPPPPRRPPPPLKAGGR